MGFLQNKVNMFTHKNIFIPPLAITKFKVIPIKFLEKKSARAGFGPDRQGHGCKERLIRLWDYRFLVVIQFLLTLFIFVFCDFEMFNQGLDKYALHQSFTDLVLQNYICNQQSHAWMEDFFKPISFLLVLFIVWGCERGMNIMSARSTELTAFSNICKDKPSFSRIMISVSASHDVHRLSDEEYWDSQGFARDMSFNSNQADLLSHDGTTVRASSKSGSLCLPRPNFL